MNFADFVIEKPNGSLLGVCSYCHICWRGRTCEVDFKVYEDTSPFTSSIDAFKELLKFLRAELNLIRVYSFVPEYLVKETKVYEAAGLFRDGTLRQRIYHKGNYSDLLVYGSML